MFNLLPAAPPLSVQDVHLWSFDLDNTAPQDQAMLSQDERERAARFANASCRKRFETGRARQRQILARYLGCQPEDVPLRFSRMDKPWLDAGPQTIGFNLSRCQERGVLAVGIGDVGVDIERQRSSPDLLDIAQQRFSQSERGELSSMTAEVGERAFFSLWSQKEALVKLTGDGLRADLSSFSVRADPRANGGLINGRGIYSPKYSQVQSWCESGGWFVAVARQQKKQPWCVHRFNL